jgi:hypothetical protein
MKNKTLIFLSVLVLVFCSIETGFGVIMFKFKGGYNIRPGKYVPLCPECVTDESLKEALAEGNIYTDSVVDGVFHEPWYVVTRLCLRGCKNLGILPSLDELVGLEELSLCDCIALVRLPDLRRSCPKLKFISLYGCTSLPEPVQRWADGKEEIDRLFADLEAAGCIYVPSE